MRKYSTILIITFLVIVVKGQNLVPNSSFEDTKDTISRFTKDNIDFNKTINLWSSPNTASPDLITPIFNEKFVSPSKANSGNNSIGLQCIKHKWEDKFWSEYIGVKLLSQLSINSTYKVEYYIKRANCIAPSKNKDEKMSQNFGIYFSALPIKKNDPNILIKDLSIKGDTSILISSSKWTKFIGYYTPKDKDQYLYLGLFKTKEEVGIEEFNCYIQIDDISVTRIKDFEEINYGFTIPVGSKIPLRKIKFKSGSTDFSSADSKVALQLLTDYLNDNPSLRIRINGHTDSVGNKESNQELSQNRANTIAVMLIQNGIAKDRIEWEGFGEEMPIADNSTEKGRAINRRVEFEVID